MGGGGVLIQLFVCSSVIYRWFYFNSPALEDPLILMFA